MHCTAESSACPVGCFPPSLLPATCSEWEWPQHLSLVATALPEPQSPEKSSLLPWVHFQSTPG